MLQDFKKIKRMSFEELNDYIKVNKTDTPQEVYRQILEKSIQRIEIAVKSNFKKMHWFVDGEVIHDLVIESFKYLRGFDVRKSNNFEAYLCTVVNWKFKDWCEKNKRIQHINVELEDNHVAFEDLHFNEDHEIVRNNLKKLQKFCQTLLDRKFFWNMSTNKIIDFLFKNQDKSEELGMERKYSEIADIKVNTINQKIKRCLSSLRDVYEREEKDGYRY